MSITKIMILIIREWWWHG